MTVGDKVKIVKSKNKKMIGLVGTVASFTKRGKNPYILFEGDKQHYWFHRDQLEESK